MPAVGVLLVTVAACSGRDTPDPPRPDLESVEPLVARRITAARETLADDPSRGASWGRLGEIFDVHDLTAEAVFCYEQAAALDAQEWRWPYFRGILLRASDLQRALAAFERAAELRPDYAPIHFYLGHGRFLSEDLEGAERAYLRALELDPTLVNAMLGLARVALARGRPEAALTRLQEAERRAGDEAAVHAHLATAYRALGDEARAVEAERRALAARPAQAGGMAALTDPAREELVLREGASLEWLRRKSEILVARGQPEQALAVWRPAIEMEPPSVAALVESARLLLELGRTEEAGARGRKALDLEPRRADVQVLLGDLLAAEGDRRGATAAYREAIDLDPADVDARTSLARVLIDAGRVDEALGQLRTASRLRPDSAEVRFNLARGLAWADRLSQAAVAASEVLAVEPGHEQARALLAQVSRGLWRQLQQVEAIEALENLAAAQAATGDLSDAVTTLATAIELVQQRIAGEQADDRRRRAEAWLERLRSQRARYENPERP